FFQTVKADLSATYKKFLPFIKKEGLILDLGCGSGRDSYYFKQNGYQIVAVDGSKELATQASLLLGQPVLNQLFEDIQFNEEFDGVWACASLLHVSAKELPSILIKIRESLKKEGVFYISVKEGEGSGVEDGRFFQYYSPSQFHHLISQCGGLKIETAWSHTELRDEGNKVVWLNVIGRKL
ncbi:methyltransferase domain-containing protein, partial [Turicibacter sanguinis]|nr:methyltransferase domain-containing protein [Turicibacter sanguinis]